MCETVSERFRAQEVLTTRLGIAYLRESISAEVQINFRFNVDARPSILTERFYTLGRSGLPAMGEFGQKHTVSELRFRITVNCQRRQLRTKFCLGASLPHSSDKDER
ncbi:hypothetical protein EMIT0357P_30526 [Pseudomonas marginalis]